MTKLKNSKCYKTKKNVIKLNNSKCDKSQKSKCDKTQKLKIRPNQKLKTWKKLKKKLEMLRNYKNQILTKLISLNFERRKKLIN